MYREIFFWENLIEIKEVEHSRVEIINRQDKQYFDTQFVLLEHAVIEALNYTEDQNMTLDTAYYCVIPFYKSILD